MKVVAGVIIVAVLVVGGLVFFSSPKGEVESQSDRAPSFVLMSHGGSEVSLEDSDGKIRVVNAWATWCPFCVEELPDFVALQNEFETDLIVIAINRGEDLEKAEGYVSDLGVSNNLIWLLDPRDSFYQSIGGFSMPETLFLDREGNIVIHKRGPMELSEMRDKVNQLLATEGIGR